MDGDTREAERWGILGCIALMLLALIVAWSCKETAAPVDPNAVNTGGARRADHAVVVVDPNGNRRVYLVGPATQESKTDGD